MIDPHHWKLCYGIENFLSFPFFLETEGRHAGTKAHEAVDHLTSFRQVKRRFHSPDSNHQPLPWDLGISPPSSVSLRSSRTNIENLQSTKVVDHLVTQNYCSRFIAGYGSSTYYSHFFHNRQAYSDATKHKLAWLGNLVSQISNIQHNIYYCMGISVGQSRGTLVCNNSFLPNVQQPVHVVS